MLVPGEPRTCVGCADVAERHPFPRSVHDKVIGSTLNPSFFVMVLTPVETVDNSLDRLRDTGITFV